MVFMIALFNTIIGAFFALGLAGAGHGWVDPIYYFALPLLLLSALTAMRDPDSADAALWPEASLLAIGMIANTALLLTYQRYLPTAQDKGAPLSAFFVIGWLLMWYSWQRITASSARHVLDLRDDDKLTTLWPELLFLVSAMMGNLIALFSLNADFQYSGFSTGTAMALILFLCFCFAQFRALTTIRQTFGRRPKKSGRQR
jgi:hypothetical protein